MQDVVELLSELVAAPSVNPMGRPASGSPYFESRMTAVLEKWLSGRGLALSRQSIAPERENLLAVFRNPASRVHLLLEAHQDTAPVEGMTIPPFEPRVEDGRLYGRGSCDTKGPMTSMLLALARLAKEKPASAANVTLALTVDEEHTFLGAAELVRRGIKAEGAIVAEPTKLDVIVSHKGALRWETVTRGRACHSSAPTEGINAIYRMGPVVEAFASLARELNEAPKDPLVGGPTLSVGRIRGGSAVNVVPDHCVIEIDRRLVPGEDPAAVYEMAKRYLAERVDEDSFSFMPPWLSLEPLSAEANQAIAASLSRSINRFHQGHRTRGVPFGADSAVFARAGIPSVVFGPGDIAQAHTKDEWVELDQVARAVEILFDLCVDHGLG